MQESSTIKWGEDAPRYIHCRVTRKKQFWSKLSKRKERNRKAELLNNMEKELEVYKEVERRKYTLIHSDWQLKRYEIGKS